MALAQTQQESATEAAQPLLFALDIGTRSVIGVVGRCVDGLFRVVDTAVREHAHRAMMDGQIEDIEQVAALARAVKEELEQRQGVQLRQVCVAAAGRALKTIRAQTQLELESTRAVSAQTVYRLEMEAVEQARCALEEESGTDGFYCVGRSVIRYVLDGYSFQKIKGHKGKLASVELIATFLPGEVVDSLYAAMSQAGLCVESITLEPIAALNAVIPQELRLLNLALVDVGAGTSDIALCENGSVAAYAMATIAGDEITEELIRKLLVDFSTAEQMKQTALEENTQPLVYEDILGLSYEITRAELLDQLRPAAQTLAKTIADKILEVNGKAPSAVFLVGGGSKTPFLRTLVAEYLQLGESKVAIGGNNFMKRVVSAEFAVDGPEFATPLGIALTASGDESRDSFFITINGKRVPAFHSGTMTVLDVLLLHGYQYTDLMGRNGKSLAYRLNGEKFLVRGEVYTPAQVLVNGQATSLSTAVHKEDAIEVTVAVPGKDISLCVADILPPQNALHITVNGEARIVLPPVFREDKLVPHGEPVRNGDVLTCDFAPSLACVCALLHLDTQHSEVLCDGEPLPMDMAVKTGLALTVRALQPQPQPQPQFLETTEALPRESVVPSVAAQTALAGKTLSIRVNNAPHTLPPRESPYQFVDVLTLVDIDFSKPQGNIVLQRNGHAASYLELLEEGDDILIAWEGNQNEVQMVAGT